jgi:hypothetical protein
MSRRKRREKQIDTAHILDKDDAENVVAAGDRDTPTKAAGDKFIFAAPLLDQQSKDHSDRMARQGSVPTTTQRGRP